MKKVEFSFRSYNDLANIRAVKYLPEGDIKAILQIGHGMVEFIDRYDDFCKFLCDKGFLVVGNDHLGHGGSVNSKDEWGYFGDNGNQTLIEDMHKLEETTKKEYGNLPYFLLGHSMGSFYARQYICKYGSGLNGAIIMGTGMQSLATIKGGMFLCRLIALFKGWRYRSEFVNNMVLGANNKAFMPARTKVDWLSKDEKIVDAYVSEPRNNFVFTLNAFYSMFTGLLKLHDKNLLNNIPKDLPVLFVSGKDDPVGGFGKGVKESADSLKQAGLKDIEMKLYENDRHEILNELDKQLVYQDLYDWMIKKI